MIAWARTLPFDRRLPAKDDGATDVASLVEFLEAALGKNARRRGVVEAFVENRFRLLEQGMEECYGFFRIPARNVDAELQALKDDEKMLAAVLEKKPRTLEELGALTQGHPAHELLRHLERVVQAQASGPGRGLPGLIRRMRSAFNHPLQSAARELQRMVRDQIELLKSAERFSAGLLVLLRDMHESIRAGEPNRALTLYRRLCGRAPVEVGVDRSAGSSVQDDLEQMEDLFEQHDKLVRERLVESLRDIVRSATGSRRGSGTNRITSIMALAEDLKRFDALADAGSVFVELRQKLFETFPVWIVRKQAVPFLLPCREQSFDLVIVDEATQCRVDDSLPLMFRAKKMLVVGDDKQTVLQKDSVIDDYLFRDRELDEHLRSTQARGFKGGGSHIFALVKAIKEASVLLDEHYRCPADIIEFSNKYVYDDRLNVMQWSLPEQPPAVVVDYSEHGMTTSAKPSSGKFKGIETGMIDRFMEYVVKTIRAIEKSTGKRINVETDVALCYFLLKNEPYVKSVKDRYLRRLGRGDDVLDGAGAALQGKERDYIFYLWDVTRHNMGSFRQGDDPQKRKGELNVLMSRPKKKAFHFLHRNFEQLDHGRANITSYLWRALQRHQERRRPAGPGASVLEESVLAALLSFALESSGRRSVKETLRNIRQELLDFRANISAGDGGRVVDLIAFAGGDANDAVGIVDLSAFAGEPDAGRAVVDYYFQLKRVLPRIDPVFAFAHEMVDENGQTFRSLLRKLEHAAAGSKHVSTRLKRA